MAMRMTLSARKTRALSYILVADSMSLAAYESTLLTIEKSDTVKNDTKLP